MADETRPPSKRLDPAAARKELLRRMLAKKGLAAGANRGIPRRDDPSPAPLSFAQEALWFVDQLDPDRALHNVPGAIRLRGALDREALERGLNEIVRRHESLRSRFTSRDGQPWQQAAPHEDFPLRVQEVAGADEAARLEAARALATEEAHHNFDLATELPVRFLLLVLGEQDHVLLLNFHHIVTDGWSMGVFTRELRSLYGAFRDGADSPLAPLAIQFADFTRWQRETMKGDQLEKHMDYWRQLIGEGLPALQLPTDRPRPEVQTFRGAHEAVEIPATLSTELRALSQREGYTPFMTLTAAFLVLMHSLSRQEDVVIGSAVAHRNREEMEGLIGFLVNMLVLRVDLNGDPDLRTLLGRVRETTLGAWAHQDVPLTRIVREAQPDRDLSKTPLFQVQFSLLTPDHNPAVYGYGLGSGLNETLEWPGLKVEPVEVQYDNARYDVAVFLWDLPDGICGTIEYSSDLFDAATVRGWIDRFQSLLRLFVEQPTVRLSEMVARLRDAEQARASQETAEYQSTLKSKLKGLKRRSRRSRDSKGTRP